MPRFFPLIVLFPALCFAAERWTVTTGDFKSSPIVISVIDDQQVSGTERQSVPLAQFVQATRSVKIEPAKGLVLCVAGGDRLIGQPLRIDGANLVWFAAGIGEVAVPLEKALGVLRDQTAQSDLLDARGEDEIHLLNGDAVKGIVTAVAEKSVTITPAGAAAIEVPVDNIRDILFAAPPQGRGDLKPARFTLRLSTASVLSCDSIKLAGDKLNFTVSGGAKASVPTALVASIEHTGGPVAWLSTRTPSEATYVPFFEGDFTPQFDRTVTGDPIRVNGQIVQRGIGMHSKTRMTWPVLPGDKTFRARYQIDPSLGYADVDVRVFVDDKLVHETKSFKAGATSPVVEADLSGAKTLTLEVDYGQGYDVHDRLTWIEPAIVR